MDGLSMKTARYAFFGLALSLFAVLAGFSNVFAASPDDHLIVPGQRIGPVVIGMGPSELLQALGAPDQSNTNKFATQYVYPSRGFCIWSRNNRVDMISISDSSYHTPNGIHPGSSELELQAAMGAPKWKRDNGSFIEYCYRDATRYEIGRPGTNNAGRLLAIDINTCKP
jgi:hypothetical protein